MQNPLAGMSPAELAVGVSEAAWTVAQEILAAGAT